MLLFFSIILSLLCATITILGIRTGTMTLINPQKCLLNCTRLLSLKIMWVVYCVNKSKECFEGNGLCYPAFPTLHWMAVSFYLNFSWAVEAGCTHINAAKAVRDALDRQGDPRQLYRASSHETGFVESLGIAAEA